MAKKKIKKKHKQKKRSVLRNKWVALLTVATISFGFNVLYQIYKKPTDLVSIIYPGSSTSIFGTWSYFQDSFNSHSTKLVSAKTLASIAQVESSGRFAASPEWQWKLSRGVGNIFAPASSAIGLMQITKGHKNSVSKFCKTQKAKEHVCKNRSWWLRLIPGHSIHLAAVYIDKTIHSIIRQQKKTISKVNLIKLAAITHLCGEGKAKLYARSNFKFSNFRKCGTHSAINYVNNVVRMSKKLTNK